VRDAIARERVERSLRHGRAKLARRARLDPEAETRRVARRAQQTRRIVAEARVVEHAHAPRGQIPPAAERIEQVRASGRVERERHRRDREVPAREVFVDRRGLDGRERAGPRVPLAPRARQVDRPLPGGDGRRQELRAQGLLAA
jgi:hypothetical protein